MFTHNERKMALSLVATALLVSGCGGGGGGEDATTPLNSVAAKTVILSGDARCPNGGVEIFTGVDENGDGILQVSEHDN
jgi:alkaline phosphatase